MTSFTLNRSAIMRTAWADYFDRSKGLPFCRNALGWAMKRAWFAAKQRIRQQCPINRTRDAITALESKDSLTQQDYARLGVLRAALRAHLEHQDAAPNYADKRALIESAGGRFCAVTFTKKDGSQRVMHVQPAALKNHVKGGAATDAGKRAVATRKATQPNLLPVWDAKAKAPRSINLATVSRISLDGQVYTYAA